MNLIPQIANRQSIRQFKPVAVEKSSLDRIVEAGRSAPSAKNRQPWRFIVINNKEVIRRIEQAAYGQEHVGQAPVIITACTTNIDYRMPNGQLSYPIDLSFAVAFMIIQAEAEKVGSCVVTTYNEIDIKEILSVPYSMRVVMLLLLGYSDETPFPVVKKPLNRIISYNHW